jgi:hypothetical protein
VAKAAPGETVFVPASAKRHYLLRLGPIHVTTRLTIRGAGSKKTVIDGNGGNGVFVSTAGNNTTPAPWKIERVTITGAKSHTAGNGSDAAAVASLGFGKLTLAGCVIAGNTATASAKKSTVVAGAVDSEGGALTISHCSITGNHVSDSSPSPVGAGGVDSEGGALRITASNISHNKVTLRGVPALIGGGAVSDGGALTIVRSTIADNVARATNHTQQSDGAGGVISEGGPATVINSTISGNSDAGTGDVNSGGLVNNGGTGELVYVTLTRNAGGAAANLVNDGGVEPFGSVLALAPKGHHDCRITGGSSSNGYNFSDQSSCGLNGTHDRTHGNPKLAKLANNGGPGPTEASLKGSPLIDFIPKARCAAGIKTDERGRRRPDHHESACDVGAYEHQDK